MTIRSLIIFTKFSVFYVSVFIIWRIASASRDAKLGLFFAVSLRPRNPFVVELFISHSQSSIVLPMPLLLNCNRSYASLHELIPKKAVRHQATILVTTTGATVNDGGKKRQAETAWAHTAATGTTVVAFLTSNTVTRILSAKVIRARGEKCRLYTVWRITDHGDEASLQLVLLQK